MRKIKIFIANLLLFFSTVAEYVRWKKAIKKVSSTQWEYLKSLLQENARTVFGIEHQFESIDSVKSFQNHVPIRSYEDMLSYVDRITEGNDNILTSKSVLQFGITSGSTGASKLIPYTKELFGEFQKGIAPWLWQICKQFPSILKGRTFWSVTPVGQTMQYSKGGVPIGFDDERSYFSPLAKWALRTIQILPTELSLVKNMDAFRYAVLRFLLEEETLAWMSIWNPTFITICIYPLEKEIERLIKDVHTGTISIDLGLDKEREKLILSRLRKDPKRAQAVKLLYEKWKGKSLTSCDERGHTFYEALWPNLKFISCWSSGEAISNIPKLQAYFPNVAIQPKGLLATEAFVSFPYDGEKSALSINSHFFEFESADVTNYKKIKLAHELEVGKEYSVIVTTGGGLYRYRLHDRIVILGHTQQCPLIKFIDKENKVVDVQGEKMNEQFVKEIVFRIFSEANIDTDFLLVSPEETNGQPVAYSVFVQNKGRGISKDLLRESILKIENEFLKNYHYSYCRHLGQLDHAKMFSIMPECDAEEIYISTCMELGQRLGDIKQTILHPFRRWSTKFNGEFI